MSDESPCNCNPLFLTSGHLCPFLTNIGLIPTIKPSKWEFKRKSTTNPLLNYLKNKLRDHPLSGGVESINETKNWKNKITIRIYEYNVDRDQFMINVLVFFFTLDSNPILQFAGWIIKTYFKSIFVVVVFFNLKYINFVQRLKNEV